jgi:hypothetical protein
MRHALTPEEIYNGCYVNICDNNNEIFDSLRNNPKVSFDGKRFSYKVISYLSFLEQVFCTTFSKYNVSGPPSPEFSLYDNTPPNFLF